MNKPETTPDTDSEQSAGPESLTDEQLLEQVNAGPSDEVPTEQGFDFGVVDDPDEESEADEEETEPEAEAEEPEDTGPQDEDQEESEDAPESDEVDVTQARLDEALAKAAHFETVAGRNAGKVGFLTQRLEALEARMNHAPAPPRQEDDALYDDEPTPQPRQPQSPGPPPTDSNQVWIAQQAVATAVANFEKANPSLYVEQNGQKLVDPLFASALESRRDEIFSAVQSGNAAYAESETKAIFREVWSDVSAKRAEARRVEAERKSADQAKSLRGKKVAAASAGATGRKAQRRAAPRSIKEIKTDDLGKAIDRLGGGLD